jgi:hypothetical protein
VPGEARKLVADVANLSDPLVEVLLEGSSSATVMEVVVRDEDLGDDRP